jgi:hypothetical protein
MRRSAKESPPPRARANLRILLAGALLLLAATGCRSEDFQNKPRPPQPVQLTAVITSNRVTVEPNEIGTGPIVIVVSNQDDASHTISLTGNGVREVVGPINPLDTASLQKSLAREGIYLVSAGSPVSETSDIEPARLSVGRGRQSARDDVQLP